MAISAVFLDSYGVKYEQIYQTRKGFLSAVARSKHRFVHAVDLKNYKVMHNKEEVELYKKGEL